MQELKNQEEPISKMEEVQIQKESTNGDEELIQDKSFHYCFEKFTGLNLFEAINKSISKLVSNKYYEADLLICLFSFISKEISEEIKNKIKSIVKNNSELNDKINRLCKFFTEIQNEIKEKNNFNPIMKVIKEKKLYKFVSANMYIFITWITSLIQNNDHLTIECKNFVDLYYGFVKYEDTDEHIFIESILKLKLVYEQKNIEINTDMILEVFIRLSNTLGRKLNKNEVSNLLKNFSPYVVVKSGGNYFEKYGNKVSEFGGSINKWHSFFDVCEPGSFTKDIANSIFENRDFKNAFAAILKYDKLEIFEEKRPFGELKTIIYPEQVNIFQSSFLQVNDYKSAINFLKLCKEGKFPQDITLISNVIQTINKCKITDEFLSDGLLAFPPKSLNKSLIESIIFNFLGDLSKVSLKNLISRYDLDNFAPYKWNYYKESFYNVNFDFEDKYNYEIPFLQKFNGTLTEELILDLSKLFHVSTIIDLIKTKFDQQQIPYEIFRPAWHMLEKWIEKNYINNYINKSKKFGQSKLQLHLKSEHFYDKFEKNHVLYLLENCDYRGNIQEFAYIIYSYAMLKLDHKNIFFKTDYEAFWNTVKTVPIIRQKFLFACIMHVFDTKQLLDEKTKLLFENLDVKTGFFRRRINLNEVFANAPIMLRTLHIFIHNNPEAANLLKEYFLWDFKAIQIDVINENANTRNSDNDNNQSIALAESEISASDSEKQSLKPQMEQAKTKLKLQPKWLLKVRFLKLQLMVQKAS